ncbi:MAG TPA: hypothetical protein VLH10_05495 [Yinghuangia sp.]|uniref:hypothetical protein n=1 Tax=Yinghuangia sp. YIM S10712 TaxID=3436930 RepID=UPI002C7255E6|nr:hypothetical protein [Yinghuangia sp.]
MAASVMPAADTLTRTLLAARAADWRGWTRHDAERVAAALAWRAVDGDATAWDPGVPGLHCRWVPAEGDDGCPELLFEVPIPEPAPTPDLPQPIGPGRALGFGGLPGDPWGPVGAGFPRDRDRELDAAHTRLIAAVTAALGPAPWRGGPGAWLRWRNREITLRLARDHARGALTMELFPTAVWEAREQRQFADARGLEGLPYDWCVSRPDLALAELFLPFGPDPADWDDFRRALPELLACAVTDLPLVGWIEPILLVVGEVAHPSRTVELRIGQDRLELGGIPDRARQVWLRPGADHGRRAGGLLLEAFAAWDITAASRMRVRSWTSGGYIDFPGLGVRPEGTHPDDLA